MYQITKLPNGLTVASAEMPHMMSVSLGIWIRLGSRYEPAPINGVCHFIEHLLFKGTQKRSASQIAQAVEGIGGSMNAYTSEETTCFHARAGADHLEEILDVLFDMLLASKFAPAEIAKERNVIKEEMAMYLDEPQHHVQELLNATLWPGQPLGRPITGTAKTLDSMNRDALLRYLRSNYVAANSMVVAAGKVNHRRLVSAVARHARRFPIAARPAFQPVRLDQRAPKISLFTKRTEQTQVALAVRTCSRHDPRRHALRLLNTILGENSSSRLFQAVREDHGLAYSIYSSPSFFDDTGDLVISAGLDTANLQKALRLVLAELRRLGRTLVSPAELRRARDYVIGQVDLGLESSEGQMNWLGEQLASYGRFLKPAAARRRLRQVTTADVRAVARDFLRPDRLNLALVTPLKSVRTFAHILNL